MREECPGSRGEPVGSTVVERDELTLIGECPLCGERMELGYAGLLPVHVGHAATDR